MKNNALTSDIQIYADPDTLATAAAERFIELSAEAVADHGGFHVALSGGSTPKLLYKLLASKASVSRVPWQHVNIYFGDERNVPPDHADSNYRMACESLLHFGLVPAQQIHRVETESGQCNISAAAYADCLLEHLPADQEGIHFDLVLLGLGPDGHIASLFPDTEILRESEKPVAAVFVKKLDTWRISLTFPIINQSRHILMLVAGENKQDILAEIMNTTPGRARYPIEMLQPAGTIEWYLDKHAARLIAGR